MVQRICQWILSQTGWKIVGQLPDLDRYVLIVAPHTSNWDLIVGLLGRCAINVRICFLAKKEIFVFPFNYVMRALGGHPVDRSSAQNRVEQIVEHFRNKKHFIIGLAPEGTRSPVKRWKLGFYHIAREAQVPIVMVGLDYPSKEIRIASPLKVSGHPKKDYEAIMDFYKTIRGKYKKDLPEYPG